MARVVTVGFLGLHLTAAPLRAESVFEVEGTETNRSKLDQITFQAWEELQLPPTRQCSDAVFIRRVFLDTIGTLPKAAEVQTFLQSRATHKRGHLIDQLLERAEYADYWAMKWSDTLRLKAEFPVNLWPNAAQAYHRWLRESLQENKRYDQLVRELLTASGSNFRTPPVNFYRAMQDRSPQGMAQTVALTFMGCRAEQWPPEKLAGLAAFFSFLQSKSTGEWKEEIIFHDPAKTNAHTQAMFPDGQRVTLQPELDPRLTFAAWLTSGNNRWLARSLANRTWFWLLGRGIVHEPDDLRPDNPPTNSALLAHLEVEFIASGYDFKQLLRLILNSQTYQLAAGPTGADPRAEENFACYAVRRLDAEVLIDAICGLTGSTEKYSSAIPEPFTFIPEDFRAIALPDGSITSPFLEMFDRPPRDTGFALERNNRMTAAQRLHLLNSSHIQRKIAASRLVQTLATARGGSGGGVNGLYLAVLSRPPTAAESTVVVDYLNAAGRQRRDAAVDIVWALLNSPEFLYRH